MSYMDLLPQATPSTAEERIRSIVATGASFTEYETLPNGDVLGAVRSNAGAHHHWLDIVVPADGGKARFL